MSRPINCDQVAWMLAAINRYLPPQDAPRVSRAREMQSYALLYELMEVAALNFEDAGAARNATPKDVHLLRTKGDEGAGNAQCNKVGSNILRGALGATPREQLK